MHAPTSLPLKPLDWYKKLGTKKGRLAAGAFVVEGPRAIGQIIQGHPKSLLEIVCTAEHSAAYTSWPTRVVTPGQLRSISSTTTPQGVLAVVRVPDDVYTDDLPETCGQTILVLEAVQDPGNVGTLIRTAAAFDVDGVVLSAACADPFSPKCVQATAGSVLSVWLRRTSQYLRVTEALRGRGYTVIAADLDGPDDLSRLAVPEHTVVALGSEAAGLSPALGQLAQARCALLMNREKAESLNVAVCGAIYLYLVCGQPRRGPLPMPRV